jgi:hypothetical protein
MPVAVELTDVPLLDAAACEAIVAEVEASRDAWTQRHPLAPFYTLGAASYLDGDELAYYQALAARANPVLAARFAGLLGQVAGAIAAHTGRPAVATERHALPGFHIFGAHPAFERGVTQIHVDKQHMALDWGVDPATLETVTFTLPVALPAHGAGLDAWAVDDAEWMPLTPAERVQLMKARDYTYHPYTAGTLVLHSGNFVHRIAPSKALGPKDARVTYHGHGVWLDGAWRLYW